MLNKTAIKKLSLLASTFLFSMSAASGTERITADTPATLGVDNGLAGFLDNDFIRLGGNHNIQTGAAGSYDIDGINLDSNTSTLNVSKTVRLG